MSTDKEDQQDIQTVDVNIIHFIVKLPTKDANKLENFLRQYVKNHNVYEVDWSLTNDFYGTWEVPPK